MKKSTTIFLLLLLAQIAFSQAHQQADSIRNKAQAKLDSLVNTPWQKKLDSLHNIGDLEKYKDSLKVVAWADSLKQKVSTTFANKQNALQSKVDSLLVRNQPPTFVQRKIDSLQNKQQALLNEISAKQNQLQEKLNTRYKKWGRKLDSLGLKTPTEAFAKVDGINTNISSIGTNGQLNTLNPKLPIAPNVNFPSASLPNTPTFAKASVGAPNASMPNAPIPSLNSNDFANLNLSKDLSNVGGKLSVPGTEQMKQWNDQLKNVSDPLKDATGKLNDAKDALKDPGKAAEEATKQLKDVNALGKEMSNAEKLMKDNEALKTAEMMKDPEKMKEEAAKQAVDHFAGKEQALKQAMDQMGKIKMKVPSLESLDKLPKNYKWPKNGLKGKPFRERIRFGTNFGVQGKRDSIIVDLFPNVSYHLTGRVELGGGMIYRLRESTKTWQFDQANPVWGFNMFGTFKMFKSVRFRVETDAANYPKFGGIGEPIERRWRWTWLAGVQTE
ncbi:MAG: hypothetical protein IM606_14020, partial [Cytophagales bacterium]|nr:hypothetical protein [Cytophagales bacterium]